MLTKKRKWLFTLFLAFVALFLVACGGETEQEPVEPEALQIVPLTRTVVVGEDMLLTIAVTPSNASKEVEWKSADTSIADVDDGVVTALKPGKVKITATSTLDATKKDDFEVVVLESRNELNVLLSAMSFLDENMPTQVDKDVQLPQYANPDVEIVYFDSTGAVIPNGLFKVSFDKDSYDASVTIFANIYYGDEKLEDLQYVLQVVRDLEANEFNALQAAQAEVAEYLEFYQSYKISGDLTLPKSLSQLREWTNGEVPEIDVAITWSTDSGMPITGAGTYNRPNEDTNVQLRAYFATDYNSALSRFNLVAKGYTKAEKLEWLKANVLNIPNEVTGANLLLPVSDSKFNTTITWESSNEEVYTAAGKMANPYQEEPVTVTLTATVVYDHADEDIAFEEKIAFELVVNPATNDLQRTALAVSNELDERTDLHYFPYGVQGRASGNQLPLPLEVAEGKFRGVPITWTVSEEGVFDANFVLQKQFLRYHEVTLTYSITAGTDTATGEMVINVGVAKYRNTKYIGGNMYSRSANQDQPWDELHQMSPTDGPNGNIGASTNVGGWTGYTFTGVVDGVPYQWFVSNLYSTTIEEDHELVLDDNGVVVGGVPASASNRQLFVANNTEDDLKFPVQFHTGGFDANTKQAFEVKNADGGNADRNGTAADGWMALMVVGADGVVEVGFGGESYQQTLVKLAREEAGDEELVVELEPFVVIPAGGFLMSSKYAGPLGGLQGILFNEGQEFTVETFDVLG